MILKGTVSILTVFSEPGMVEAGKQKIEKITLESVYE
jgi:hypothetical protein